MSGGSGDDTYQIEVEGDAALEGESEGVDTAQVRNLKLYALPSHVENLYLFGKMLGFGNGHDNLIVGNIYAQTITAGRGDDVIVGGAGTDVFVFAAGSGYDVVTDFTASQSDRVRIQDYGFMNFGQVTGAMTQQGSDVVLQLSTTDAIKFLNKTIGSFQSSDFQLASDSSNLQLTFSEEFDAPLDFYDPMTGLGLWSTHFATGDQSGLRAYTSRTLRNNNERQLYVDPEFVGSGPAAVEINPFTVSEGVLDITARATSDAEKQDLWFYKYASGILTTPYSFAQTYGYFEVRAQLPSGQGVWPAFWLLPTTFTSPPELDVFEQIGGGTAYFTSHSNVTGVTGATAFVPNISSQFHTYGVLWTNTDLTWYVDGVAVASHPTPSDMNTPMYMLVNLAIGGNFPGSPPSDFTSASLQVDYIRAYSLNAAGGADGDLGVRTTRDVVGSGQQDAVAFTVTGLDTGATGVVTFTDSAQHSVAVSVSANGAGVADLSALADGAVTVAVAANGPDGGIVPGVGQRFTFDPTVNSDLSVSAPFAVGADRLAAAPFTVSGLEAGFTGLITFTDILDQTVTAAVSSDGLVTVDLTGLADGPIAVCVRQDNGAGLTLSGRTSRFGLDTTADELGDMTLLVTPMATAQNSGRLAFTLVGLDRDAAGTVTFTDRLGTTAVTVVNNNSAPFLDLSGLVDGQVTATISAIDDAGNTAVGAPVTLTLDTVADAGGDLSLSLPLAMVNAYGKTYVPITVSGLDTDAETTVTFTDGVGQTVTAGVTANGSVRANLSALAAGTVGVSLLATDSAGNTAALSAGTLTLAPGSIEPMSHVVFAPPEGGAVTGTAGDDLIVAGAGNDAIAGEGGANTVSYDGAGAGVKVGLVAGVQQTIGAGKDSLAQVQSLVGSTFQDTLTGDTGANVLMGGAGDDILYGLGGDDVLAGGAGADVMAGGAGIDTASYFDAPAAVSVSLALTAAQDTGGAGVDTLGGFENLTGSDFDDMLAGNSQANTLRGGLGGDVLVGGAGPDVLTGGGGADRFVFTALTDSKVAAGGQDRIVDFDASQGDRIDLSQIDANSQTGGDDAFTWAVGFTGARGQLVAVAQAAGQLVQGDINGDAAADFAILVQTTVLLQASDFIL